MESREKEILIETSTLREGERGDRSLSGRDGQDVLTAGIDNNLQEEANGPSV